MSRWNLGEIEKLPSYIRIVFRSVFETLEEIEQEMSPRGRSRIVHVAVDEVSPPTWGSKNCSQVPVFKKKTEGFAYR